MAEGFSRLMSSIAAAALVFDRAAKNIWAGLCFESCRTVSLPKPTFPCTKVSSAHALEHGILKLIENFWSLSRFKEVFGGKGQKTLFSLTSSDKNNLAGEVRDVCGGIEGLAALNESI